MLTLHSAARYWRTIRHLKPVQVYGRIMFRFRRPAPDRRAAPPVRAQSGHWVLPPERPVSLRGPALLHLLNRDVTVHTAADWSNTALPPLVLYNLHYFDDLAAPAHDARRTWQVALIERWIAENPPGEGPGWAPYPTSLRIVNWIKWAHRGGVLPDGFTDSLAVQARWLTQRIEYYLQANHLFVNAKALLIAGLWFEGAEADDWRALALHILDHELPEQVHRDGGHYEASPMYHALMFEDLLDLINCARRAPGVIPDSTVHAWCEASVRMDSWLRQMSHPDGDLSFFNDAAFGVAPRCATLRAYATALDVAERVTPLADSGYVRADRGRAALLCDLAPVGPDYQPGHAHADTLSFELSLGEMRVLVNSGTSTYDIGPQRRFERSTQAHNTVSVNHGDSSEVWGGFRVGRRARVIRRHVDDRDGAPFVIEASHDGYHAQPGRPTHERRWELTPDRLVVTDRCIGAREATARFLLHPVVVPRDEGVLQLPDGSVCRWSVVGGHATTRAASWFPEFNRQQATHCIEVTLGNADCTVTFTW